MAQQLEIQARGLRSPPEVAPARPAPVPAPREAPPPAPAATAPAPAPPAPAPPRRRRRLALPLAGVLLVAALAGFLWWDDARHFESTDDAFIAARQFALAPKVAGYIVAVPVTDNQHVAAGDVIARIDDRDYRVALEQAEAQVAAARASIQNNDAQALVQQAQVAQSRAQLEQAQAALTFARDQAARYGDLARRGVGSVQNAQQYESQLRQQEAAVKTAQAALDAAQRQLATVAAGRASAVASLAQASAERDRARLDLDNTVITAAQPGHVVGLSAAAGQYVAVGTALAMFVPDTLWVAANFKETQLSAMRPGQPASVRIDAYPHLDLRGHVASIQPGSGVAFALLPAQNATGNYVKITQRVPVKIVLDDPPADLALGPGMSVVPSVRVDPSPSLLERLRTWL